MAMAVAIATAVYLVLNLTIGFWRWRSASASDYIAGGRSFRAASLTLSFAGTAIGGGMVFAVAQAGFEAGIAVLALPLSYVLGYGLVHFAVPRIRSLVDSSNGLSLYDIIDARLAPGKTGKPLLHVLIALVNFGMFFFMLAGQFSILATFFEFVLNVSSPVAWTLSLGVIGGSTLVYAIIGGLRKDIATDAIQVVAIGVAMVVLLCFAATVGDFGLNNLPSSHWNMTGYGVVFPLAVLLFFSPAFLARFDYWQRIIAAKNDRSARSGVWWSLVPVWIAYVVFCGLGMYAKALSPSADSPDAAMIAFQNLLPRWAYILVLIGVYGAVMSTADTLLNVASVSLYSLVTRRGHIARADRNVLGGIRWMSLLVGLAAGGLVLIAPDAVELIIGGFSSLVILSPALSVLIFSKRPNATAMAWSVGLGYGVFVASFALMPEVRKSAFVIGFIVAILPLAVAWLTRTIRQRKSLGDT